MLEVVLVVFGVVVGVIFGLILSRKPKPQKKTEEKPRDETFVPRPLPAAGTIDPLAIIGIGCRFPKSQNKNEFWDMLTRGVNGIVKIPKDRWDADLWHDRNVNRRGRMSINKGGFLTDVDKFDAQFFGLSGHEAHRMDPQHRFLMEVVYHAFQDAGLTLEKHIQGKKVGCFIGISCHDYNEIETQQVERVNLTGHTITGISQSIASNRISYVFDMRGPSFSIDTACSSTLMALNEAFFNINHGLCDIAIVGGVNMCIRPETTICFSKGGFLSPDCQCKSFDEAANGYIRSEGVGVVILEDGDKVYSSILGTTINHDGKTNGMSLPSQEAQESLMKGTYERIGLDPKKIQFVEAHGTGTKVGDPIEANAIGNVLSKTRDKHDKLYIGSVKANIGHCEPASAVAGLIKLSLAMKNRVIPKNILIKKKNPKIKWDKLRLDVPTENIEWLGDEKHELYGAVSSFGFGGANGHAVLKMSPEYEQPFLRVMGEGGEMESTDKRPYLFTVSARSEESLKAYCESYIELCQNSEYHIRDICYTTNIKRDHFKFRVACVVYNKAELLDKLDTFVRNDNVLGLSSGRVLKKTEPKMCFVYSGQGPQYFAMGRQLIKTCKVFREKIERCDKELSKYTEWSLMEELLKPEKESRINETRIAQPAIFSIQYALTHLWVDLGIIPSAVIGHSIGEVAAAWASGNLVFEDAIKVIFHRSKTQDRASGKGKMLAVAANLEQAQELCRKYPGTVGVATINGPNLAVLSGNNGPIKELAKELTENDTFNRILRVTVPFHSHHMDPLKNELMEDLKDLKFEKRHLVQYSTVTGDVISDNCDNDYWFRNVRQTVLFAQAANNIVKDGYGVFVEIANHPILSKYVEEVMERNEVEGIIVNSIKRKAKDEMVLMYDNFAKLHCFGVRLPLDKITQMGNFVDLPLYPFQKTRYWLETKEGLESRLRPFKFHPLLKEHTISVKNKNDHFWKIDLDTRNHPFIADHIVQGECIYPGAGLSELAMACAIDAYGREDFQFLRDLRFAKAVYLPVDDYCPEIQFNLNNFDGEFTIYSRKDDRSPWTEHCGGKIDHLPGSVFESETVNISEWRQKVKDENWMGVDIEGMYKKLFESGLMLGPSFQGIKQLWTNSVEVNGLYSGSTVAYVEADVSVEDDIDHFLIHPGLLDSAFQSMFGILFGHGKNTGVYIPIKIDRIKFYSKPGRKFWTYGRIEKFSKSRIIANIWIFDHNDEVAIEIQGFQCQYIDGTRGLDENFLNNFLFKHEWAPIHDYTSPRESFKYLPTPGAELVEEIAKLIPTWPEEKRIKEIYEGKFTEEFDNLIEVYGARYLVEMGVSFEKGVSFKGEDLIEKNGVQPIFHKLFYHIVMFLERRKVLNLIGEKNWEIIRIDCIKSDGDINRQMAKFDVDFKDPFEYEMVLLKKCVPNLVGIITGKINAVELLFPSSEWNNIVEYYTQSASFGLYNKIANHSLTSLLDKVPKEQTINVLEIGAGTGGLTANILKVFPKERTRYMFTDISKMFLDKATERFKEYKFMDFQLFNIEKEEDRKRFAPQSFDIIIASNVVHATEDLEKTILNVKHLLAPGGYLVMLEVTNIEFPTYMDFVFGMTEGWWLYNDNIRGNHPSIPSKIWKEFLVENLGFDTVVDLSFGENDQQAVFIAQNGKDSMENNEEVMEWRAKVEGKWVVFSDDEKHVCNYLVENVLPKGNCWVVYGDENLEEMSEGDMTATINPNNGDHMIKFFEKFKDGEVEGIVYLWGISDVDKHTFTYESVENCFVRSNFGIVNFMKEVVKYDMTSKVFLLTNQCYEVVESDSKINVMASSMWGFGRVLIHENMTNLIQIVDLSTHNPSVDELSNLGKYISGEKKFEVEIALRGELEFVQQLNHITAAMEIESNSMVVDPRKDYFHSEVETLGVLDSTVLCKVNPLKVGDNDVEINVHAAGMNFKDVMNGMKMLDEAALVGGFTGPNLGMECSGVVSKVGSNVTKWKVGDEVVAISPDSYASFVVTREEYVQKKPGHLSFDEAATIPFAYITAYYSLVNVGRILKDETVLIHSATGGVGVAAINICKWFGCKIIATAGTDAKRKFLRETMGIENVFNSRSLDFAPNVLLVTNGEGVDVILNSLSGAFIQKNIEVMKPYGRFLELGKTDIYDNNRITLRPFGNNLTYSAIDIDKLLTQRPGICGGIFEEFMKRADSMISTPLKVFPISQIKDALMFMAGAKHLGKLVLNFTQEKTVRIIPPTKVEYKENATYVIAGGTGGFGFEVCKYMVGHGARNIVLFSRRGVTDEYVLSEMKKIEATAKIHILEGDVTDQKQMKEMFDHIKETMPPIRGVINSVLRLKDAFVIKMDMESMMVPIKPKCLGMVCLHEQIKDIELDFVVSFTSIASSWGTLGQGNYAAANTFLEGYTRWMRKNGKNATAMAWGALGEVGYVKRTKSVDKILQDQGWVPIVLAYSTEIFGFNVKNGTENCTTIQAIWDNLLKTTNSVENQATRESRRWENFFTTVSSKATGGDDSVENQIMSIEDEEEKKNAMHEVSRVQVSKISGLKTEEIDLDEPIIFYGFDSLMTNQLRNWIQSNFGVEYSLLKIMKGISLRDLCNEILKMKAAKK